MSADPNSTNSASSVAGPTPAPTRASAPGSNAVATDPQTPLRPDESRTPRELGPEVDLWTGRTHWKHFAGLILRVLLIDLVAAIVLWQTASRGKFTENSTAWWIFIAVIAVGFAYLMVRIGLTILNERYRLTSQRLFLERGILSQTVDQLELVRVDDVRINKSLLNRIFGTGTVTIMTTDASNRNIQLVGVVRPEEVAEAVRTHVRASRQRSLYVENI